MASTYLRFRFSRALTKSLLSRICAVCHHHSEMEAPVLSLFNDLDSQLRFRFGGISWRHSGSGLEDCKDQGEGDILSHPRGVDGDHPVLQFAEIATGVMSDIVGGFPFFLSPVSSMQKVNALPARACCNTLSLLCSSCFSWKAGISHKVMQRLRIALTNGLGESWQGCAFDRPEHPDLDLLEMLKTAHSRKEILVELRVFVHKGYRWSSSSRLCHDSSPHSEN